MRITLAGGSTVETDDLSDVEVPSSYVYWGGDPECAHEWKENSPPYGRKYCSLCGRIKSPR